MEYCEVGDLAYHIKKKKQKGRFTEDEILNWFIQIAIALEYIHGRKVIHRDIKTSNIFLTGNGTVKLGDFGISKVLENINEAAMTVVGTPYYMSPEVCENRPYTFKSDVWALGCVLYELCTLEHAFLADNLLGLVYKIVKGNYDAIPDEYSDDLKELVGKTLNKDESQRPTVQEILLSPFLKTKMEDFVNNRGNIGSTTLKIKTIGAHKPVQDDDEELMKNLMPAEHMKLHKELKSKREAEEMKKAIKKNISSYGAAKERKFNEFYSSKEKGQLMKGLADDEDDDEEDARGSSGRYNQFKVDPNSQTDFSCNDRCEDTYQLSNSFGTEISQLTAKESTSKSQGKFSSYGYDNREIKASGKYSYEERKLEDDDYPDDFEDVTKNPNELEDVLDNYKRVLSGDITLPGQMSLKKQGSGGFSPISEAPSSDEMDAGTLSKLRNAKEKKICFDYFGEDLYHEIYSYLKEARENEVDDTTIQSKLKYFVGEKNKDGLSMCFKLDQLVFKEIMFG